MAIKKRKLGIHFVPRKLTPAEDALLNMKEVLPEGLTAVNVNARLKQIVDEEY